MRKIGTLNFDDIGISGMLCSAAVRCGITEGTDPSIDLFTLSGDLT